MISEELQRQFEKLPPHDLEAEMGALGSMMLCGDDSTAFDLIRTRLHRDFFYQPDHQIIFDMLCLIAVKGKPIDVVILRDELRSRQMYEEVGGGETLGKILNSVPSGAHGEHYARIVREKALLRSAIATGNELLRRGYAAAGSEGHASSIISDAAEKCLSLLATGTSDRFVSIEEASQKVIQRKLDGGVSRIKTGLDRMDDLVGGIPMSKFAMVAGRPGMGKSQYCKQLALSAAMSGIPSAVITIEEDEGKVAENMIANLSGIENRKIAYGNFGKEEWDEVGSAIQRMSGVPFWVNDHPATLAEVEEAITTAALKHKCKLIIVDYLQLIDPGACETENREITKISKTLKRLAKRLNIALIAACQLNRGNEKNGVRLPTLHDLRGSGSLEQDGDLISLLHRNDYYLSDEELHKIDHQLKVIVAKNKDGPTGTVPLYFDSRTQRISNWEERPLPHRF